MKISLTLILFLVSSFAYSMGLSDWSATTPGGNEINDFSNKTIYLKNGEQLDNIGKWYFYKGYIIGQPNFTGYLTDPNLYFVIHESSCKIDTFRTQGDWQYFVESKGLKPTLWTRWYSSDWDQLIDGILLVLFFYFYVSIPLLILVVIAFYRAISRESLNIRKPYTLISLFIVALFLFEWLPGKFPQSI